MSNLLYLAQSTQPASDQMAGLLALLVLAGACTSAYLIVRRRWYRIPPVPSGDAEPGVPLLAGATLAAAALFMSMLSVLARLLDLSPEALKTPEGMRRMTMFTPAAQLVTAAFVLALLSPYLPRAFHWTREHLHYFRQAMAGYLLALPWVFVTGGIVAIVIELFDLDAKKKHLLFEIWSGEQPGATAFKMIAIFSAVIAAPVVEELFFRGLIQRLAHRLTGSAVISIAVASLAFTATHSPWTTQPSIFVLSMFLGWIYFRSGSILVPMLMHAIFNAIQFLLFLAITGGESIPAS